MPIPVEDLDLHPHPTGKQILELFFGEAAKYRDTYVLPEHCQTAQVADDFINWVTNAIKAKELELYYHSSSAKPSLGSTRINYGMGSVYWFERCEFYRDAFFYWIRDKKIISILQARGIKVEKALIKWLEDFPLDFSESQVITSSKKSKSKTPDQKKKYGHGRSDPGGKIQTAIQKLKGAGIAQSLIPYKPEIIKLLPNKNASPDRKMTPEQYLDNTGMKLSTIKTLAREIYKP